MKGKHNNPYFVLVSEIMLQQTKVITVIPYYYKFISKFRTIQDLSLATEEDVLLLWKGMGYYSRAIRLLKCAKIIVKKYNGVIPNTYNILKKLPGIGDYTASSILAFVYDKPSVVIDGNVNRIISRYYNLKNEIKSLKLIIKKRAQIWLPNSSYSDYASAIIDLGAIICTPKNPLCISCPLKNKCKSFTYNSISIIPKINKTLKKEKYYHVYFIYNNNEILIRENKNKKLYLGFIEFPWIIVKKDIFDTYKKKDCFMKYKLTHINLYLNIKLINIQNKNMENIFVKSKNPIFKDSYFININNIEKYIVSSLFIKILNKCKNILKNKKIDLYLSNEEY